MLNKKNTNQIILGVIGSILAAVVIWLFQKTLALQFWQIVSLYLLVLSTTLSVLTVYLFRSLKDQADSANGKLKLIYNNKPDIAENIKGCKSSFRFLGISSKRTMSNPVVQQKLIELGRDKGEIKILLLNPDSEFVKNRANDENESSRAWVSEINATVERLKNLANREHINIEVRLYDQYPVWRLSIMDEEEMYINFFLKGQQGPQSQMLYVKNHDNDLFNAFLLEYERIWDTSVDA